MGKRVVFFIIATLIMVSVVWGNPMGLLKSVVYPTPPSRLLFLKLWTR